MPVQSPAAPACEVRYLGVVPYRQAWELQKDLGRLRAIHAVPDTLLLLEHPPTYTLGRTADPAHILLTAGELGRLGIEIHNIDRGGDVTYHGPGQLVGYPILLVENRRDLLSYIRKLEEVLIRSLADFNLAAGRIAGLSGVWIGERKIAAIGVKMGRVTTHGFALNVTTDLRYFDNIIPCGIRDKGVTSMAEQLAETAAVLASLSPATVAESVARHFGGVFDRVMGVPTRLLTAQG